MQSTPACGASLRIGMKYPGKYSYHFAPDAFDDLEAALHYIERELSNPKAASDLAEKIFCGIEYVREFPDSGVKVDNPYLF